MDFEATFKRADDILRQEGGCGTELDYSEQTTIKNSLEELENKRVEEEKLRDEEKK